MKKIWWKQFSILKGNDFLRDFLKFLEIFRNLFKRRTKIMGSILALNLVHVLHGMQPTWQVDVLVVLACNYSTFVYHIVSSQVELIQCLHGVVIRE